MIKEEYIGNQPCTLKIVLETQSPEKLWIKFSDASQNHTFYTKRYAVVDGEQSFSIRMPQSPDKGLLIIYNDKNTLGKGEDDKSFRLIETSLLPLTVEPLQLSKSTKNFVHFAQEFSERAGILSASKKGDVYKSDDRKFTIEYFTDILDEKGRPVGTPARINKYTGVIQVSHKQFKDMSVPMRMAILLHEFSHFWINSNPSSEIQADINGLRIYLALGYPRIDAYNVFLNVFKTVENPETIKRFKALDTFIKNYEYGSKHK